MFSQNLWQHCIKKRLDSPLRGKQYNCLIQLLNKSNYVLLFLLYGGLLYCICLLSPHSAGSIVWSGWIIKLIKTVSAFLFGLWDCMFIISLFSTKLIQVQEKKNMLTFLNSMACQSILVGWSLIWIAVVWINQSISLVKLGVQWKFFLGLIHWIKW